MVFSWKLRILSQCSLPETENSCKVEVDVKSKFARCICMKQRLFKIKEVDISYCNDQSETVEWSWFYNSKSTLSMNACIGISLNVAL